MEKVQQDRRGQEHWTAEEYRKHLEKGAEGRKYKNKKTEVDGHLFDSQYEAARYSELKLLERSGQIRGFMIQPSFFLSEGIRYKPDFMVCGADGYIWTEDVKGKETKDFIIKRKLMAEKYIWLELRILK